MKTTRLLRITAVLIVLTVLFAFTGCGEKESAASPSPSDSGTLLPDGLPGGPASDGQGGEDGEEPADGQPSDSQPSDAGPSSGPYDPSIYVIEAEGSWQMELAPGYYANYECEMYIDKVDSNDNRKASGLYTGVFWLKVTLDAGEFISDLLKNAPVEMQFAAGGEGISDNLTMHLQDGYMRDPFENFDIPADGGGAVSPAKEALAGRGTFVVPSVNAYLEAHAQGVQGEKVDYEDSRSSDTEVSYVIHVEPDPTGSATERKVTLYLTTADGASATLEGIWRRLPGYPEDVLDYANSGKQGEIIEKHLQGN